MKLPNDQNEDLTLETAKGRARPKPPGGKALQRLLLFNAQRGLTSPQQYPSTAATNKKSTSRRAKAKTVGLAQVEQDYVDELARVACSVQPMIPNARSLPVTGPGETSAPTGSGPFWRFLGPQGMPNGQTYGDTRTIVSGRVSSIAVDPNNGQHVLIGSAGGGVWESFNRGTNWFPRSDYMPSCAIGAVAFNPSNSNIAYAGTGEGNWWAGLGQGIMRSTNRGTTWTMIATAPFVGQGFFEIVVDRADGNHILAATTGGLYVSTNGGTTWVLGKSGRCWDVSMTNAGGVGAEILAAFSDGVYRSTNGGTVWAKVVIAGSPANYNRLAVKISRSNPAVAYAFGASGASAYLYRRSAGVWTAQSLPAGLSTGQAWYDWFLGIAPNSDLEIYLGAIEAYRGNLSGAAWTWITISNKAGDDIHPDQHAIAIDVANANNIFVGGDGGVYFSSNKGTNWAPLNYGLGISEVEYLAEDLGSSRWIMAGLQDNGSCRYNGSWIWDHIADGDGGDCGVNQLNPNVVFHSYFNLTLERSSTKGNFGAWTGVTPAPPNTSSLFYPPVEVNNNVVAQAGVYVCISRNQGTNWSYVLLPGNQTASALCIPNADTVIAGTTSGNLYRINWNGVAWSAPALLTSPRAGAWISDIYVNPANTNRMWVTMTSLGGGRVWRSDNGGTTWTNLSAGLPNLPINAIAVDPGNQNRVWLAADLGVYQSLNGGTNWADFSNGLPNAFVGDLMYHHHARVLRAGLRNRSAWEIPVDGWLVNPVCGVQFNGTLGPNQTKKWFTFNWPATWNVLWTVMPTTFTPGSGSLGLVVEVERATSEFVTYWLKVTNHTGTTVNFEGRFEILSYY